ncbi:DDE-type integrase/transposase/recombinase [Phormidium sp. LEGE 05292]|nr:DDE-type integrase/transposase/recombinase [Phormidium sp. LEGE 05292]MBE9224916.1 DDE-type integrase/transposase/recombinase [Phormidium sp. LEGE 05292]
MINAPLELPGEVQQQIEAIQKLLAVQGTERYGRVQQQVAQQLGISVRSVQRLLKKWREQGIASLPRQKRSDRGAAKTSREWQEFIQKTYQVGNRGSRKMSRAQVYLRVQAQAEAKGVKEYPSRPTVYRILRPLLEQQQQQKRRLGWRGEQLKVNSREGLEIDIEWSNQVWQVDHTQIDLLVVDMSGEILGRPWLTIVVDTYSRCMMGMHIGFDAPSAAVVCLALRHAILPKQYSSAYELKQSWGTYGLPRYLYTDGGKDFRSQHLEQVATELGIVLCRRRKPSDGGIVERPFGTFNREFFCTVPGYTGSNVKERSNKAESEACLTLVQLEQMLVRYIVDHYNQALDARMATQSRIGRWEAGRMAQLPLLGERELDICLMRRDRRVVYRSGYIQFANLTYQGEHLAAYAGESVIIRYNPRDITTIYIYQLVESKEVFLTRAHAMGWETEILSYREAQAISQRRREAGKAIPLRGRCANDNRSLLEEVRSRQEQIKRLQRQKKQKVTPIPTVTVEQPDSIKAKEMLSAASSQLASTTEEPFTSKEAEEPKQKLTVPFVRVYDYEQMKREAGLL